MTETMALPERTKEELEARRKEVIRALERGSTVEEITNFFDVSKNSVYRWKRIYEETGFEGVEATSNTGSPDGRRLENVPIEHLYELLKKVEGSKATQRVMIALNYKQENDISQKELAKRYGINPATVSRWFSRIESSVDKPFEKTIYDDKQGREAGEMRKLPNEKFSKLEQYIEDGAESFGFSGDFWTGGRLSRVIETEFGISVSQDTGQKYLRELGWSNKKLQRTTAGRANPTRRRLKEIDQENLREKLSDIIDKPTQRLMIAILYQQGFSVPMITNWFDIRKNTIYSWFESIETEPLDEAIYDDYAGSSRKLTEGQFQELEDFLLEGAEANGFVGQLWTGNRVARVIRNEFDISVTASTARSYMKEELGWSNQRPLRRPVKQDEEAIEKFRNHKWEEIRDRAETKNKAIVFVDETKFRLVPTFKSTWAPRGNTPSVETASSFGFIAVISALIYLPQSHSFDLHSEVQRYNFETQSILSALRDMVDDLSRSSIFLLDNWSPHKTAMEKLKNEYKEEIHNIAIEWFPEYSSDLNPVDNVWGHAKYHKLPNYASEDLDELELKVKEALTEIQADEDLLRYFVEDAGLKIEE